MVLLSVAGIAILPAVGLASRASRIDPMIALRHDFLETKPLCQLRLGWVRCCSDA
jgi:hypothetical protein